DVLKVDEAAESPRELQGQRIDHRVHWAERPWPWHRHLRAAERLGKAGLAVTLAQREGAGPGVPRLGNGASRGGIAGRERDVIWDGLRFDRIRLAN
ncbi:MAG: hypothetical protein ABI903_13515, partial [Actinomycetota bacterium]